MEKYLDSSLSVQERAEDLVSRMTTEEKCSQLKYDSAEISRLHVSAYNWWNECLHGVARAGNATVFPQAIALAAMFDDEQLFKAADAISTEARAKYNAYKSEDDRDIYKGLTFWSPNVNMFRDPRWGRGQETYGEDPFLASVMGCAFVRGLQGASEHMKIAACAKHFAVHSGPEEIRHGFNAEVSPKDLYETYLPAFEALICDAHAEGVMGAYNSINGEPCCGSEYLFNVLRDKWGFDGYFVSDCWAIADFHTAHHVTKTAPESAAMALKSGCDLNCGNTYLHIMAALDEGLISESDIDKACIRLMKTRIKLGMFDSKTEYDDISYDVVDCRKHNKISLECAEKSMVLLKNNGILPLDKSKLRSIAVIGPTADSRVVLNGNYNGTSGEYVTLLDGIKREFSDSVHVYYSEGCHLFKDCCEPLALPDDRIAEACTVAKLSDAVILCVGLDSTIEGEQGDAGNAYASGDKSDLRLPESQRRLVRAVINAGKPVITVLTTGGCINPECDSDAVIEAWYPGAKGGTALANILCGKVSPSGKLPVTFYEKAENLPGFCNYSMIGRTYRYTDKNILYPFGFGLTYSKLEMLSLDITGKTEKGIMVECSFKNTGGFETDEVIEIYIKSFSEHAVPRWSLCGFKRVHLKPDQTGKISVEIPKKAFEDVNFSGEKMVYGNKFELYAGVCQPDELSQKLSGTKCLKTEINI